MLCRRGAVQYTGTVVVTKCGSVGWVEQSDTHHSNAMLPLRYDYLSAQLRSWREFLFHRQSGGSKAISADNTYRCSARCSACCVSRYPSASSFHDRRYRGVARPSPCNLDASRRGCRFATRWRLVKSAFSRNVPAGERVSASRAAKGERSIWQRRYWEHTIRDADDFARHVDYIHINPVKHGLVPCVRDWRHSSFHRMVKQGIYPEDWAGDFADRGEDFGERR